MFEIKVTGNTPEEVMNDLRKWMSFFKMMPKSEEAIKPEKEAKEVKNEVPTASKPIDEEPKGAAEEEGTDVNGNAESTTCNEANTSAEAEEPTVTLEEVRAKGTELARAGKRDLVKQVLEAAGASKLSDVPNDKLGYVMQCFEKGKVM